MKNCVYRFVNENNEIIYIGKAKDLRNRINNKVKSIRKGIERSR